MSTQLPNTAAKVPLTPVRSVLGLLVIAALLFIGYLAHTLQNQERQERLAAAQVVLTSIAHTLERAEQVGMPLDRLVGLDALVTARVPASLGLAEIWLMAPNGQQLWPIQGIHAEAEVSLAVGRHGARLQARLDHDKHRPAVLRTSLLLLLLTATLCVPVAVLLYASDSVRLRFPTQLLKQHGAALHAGDFRHTWRARLQAAPQPVLTLLRDQVHLLNERYQRTVRLIDSLQRTEPDTTRRAELMQLRQQLDARFHFAADGLPQEHAPWPQALMVSTLAALGMLLANLGQWVLLATESSLVTVLSSVLLLALGALLGLRFSPHDGVRKVQAGLVLAGLACALAASEHLGLVLASRCAAGLSCAWLLRASLQATQAAPASRPFVLTARHLIGCACVAGPLLGFFIATTLGRSWLDVAGIVAALALLASYALLPAHSQDEPHTAASNSTPSRSTALTSGVAGGAWVAGVCVLLLTLPALNALSGSASGSLQTTLLIGAACLGVHAPLLPLYWPSRPQRGGTGVAQIALFIVLALIALGLTQHLMPPSAAGFAACLLPTIFVVALGRSVSWPHALQGAAVGAALMGITLTLAPDLAHGIATAGVPALGLIALLLNRRG